MHHNKDQLLHHNNSLYLDHMCNLNIDFETVLVVVAESRVSDHIAVGFV